MACFALMMSAIMATHPAPKNRHLIKAIAKNICKYSKRRKLDPYKVLSIIKHESSFHPNLKSGTKDFGLMQVNIRWNKVNCNLYKVRCNIKTGTKIMAMWKAACKIHKKSGQHLYTHWLRHYNWNNKIHHLRVLWLAEAYRKAAQGHTYLYETIKHRAKYYKAARLASYSCIEENLCGTLKPFEM